MSHSHKEERSLFYQQFSDFWHDLYGSEYALLDIKDFSRETVHNIHEATQKVYNIYSKTIHLLRELEDDTLLELGFPPESLSFIRFKSIPQECLVGRFDFVVKEDEIKLLEFNSDTPTFIKELYHINDEVCQYFTRSNPNDGFKEQLSRELKRALLSSWKSLNRNGDAKIVFTSHQDHEEDYLTTKYLQELAGVPSEYISLDQLKIRTDEEIGVYTPKGERIDVLYRPTYPIEHLVEDTDPLTGEKVGLELMKLVEQKQIALLNPPSAFLMQSKGVQALIWGLHEEGSSFFTEKEHRWIRSYFLPTYLDAEPFHQSSATYVQKPAFGREGDTVKIYKANGNIMHEDKKETYKQSLPVYQQFISLPEVWIQTENGNQQANIMVGSFAINGQASAIGIRAGNIITDNESYFLPVGLQEE